MKALRTLCIALIALMLCMMVTALGLGISWYRSPQGAWFAAAMYVKEPQK